MQYLVKYWTRNIEGGIMGIKELTMTNTAFKRFLTETRPEDIEKVYILKEIEEVTYKFK